MRCIRMTMLIAYFLNLFLAGSEGAQASKFEQEALALGEKYIKANWVQCGDSWYIGIKMSKRYRFFELKGVEFTVHSFALTAADKANGVEWMGEFIVLHKLHRQESFNGWSQWYNAGSTWSPGDFKIQISRRNGSWSSAPDVTPDAKPGFSCTDMLKH